MATYNLTNLTTTITNLVTNSSTTLSGVTYSNNIYTHNSGTTAMVTQSLPTPIYGHKYYGRCYQKAPTDYSCVDGRFEYYAEDTIGTGLMTFSFMEPTNNEWKMVSKIVELTGKPTGSSWMLRSFTVNGITDAYRKEIIIIDLTETYGLGNEPSKEWCDDNIPFFEGTIPWINNLQIKDIIICPYSGSKKTILLPKGNYLLECWGAQGGSYSSFPGGYGGYSRGRLYLKDGKILYLYSGGQPATNSSNRAQTAGGFNGGGKGYNRYYSSTYTYGQGGGGASDIRIGTDSLYARVIVAGGGSGSAGNDLALETVGGGPFGQTAKRNFEATQTKAGTGGSFGIGASVTTNGSNYKYSSGGGGGGWYGGGAATKYSDSDSQLRRNMAGGSGYVYTAATASSYPSGCLLTSDDYLTDTLLVPGGKIPSYENGELITGNLGNGYCKITVMNFNYTKGKIKNNLNNIDNICIGKNVINASFLGEEKIFPPIPKVKNFVRADFDKGTFYNTTPTYLTGQVDNSEGFVITGRPSSSSATSIDYSSRWNYEIDLTDYNRLTFCTKQTVTNGLMYVVISDNGLTSTSSNIYASIREEYGSIPTDWYEYELDISNITGEKIISFVGGHTHYTGASGSATAYCNIRLWKDK